MTGSRATNTPDSSDPTFAETMTTGKQGPMSPVRNTVAIRLKSAISGRSGERHPRRRHSDIWPKHRPKAEAKFQFIADSGDSGPAEKICGRSISHLCGACPQNVQVSVLNGPTFSLVVTPLALGRDGARLTDHRQGRCAHMRFAIGLQTPSPH